MEFHILGASTRKARAPNERLCRETVTGRWTRGPWGLVILYELGKVSPVRLSIGSQ